MAASDLLTKRNIILAVGLLVILGLIIAGIRMLRSDPTAASRAAYKGSPTPAQKEPKKDPEASPAPISLLPDGSVPTPTPPPDRPGVIVDDPSVVVLPTATPNRNVFVTFPDITVPSTITDASLPGRRTDDSSGQVQTIFRTAPGRYLFNNLSPDALGANALVMASEDPSALLNPTTFSPMGETIQLAMLNNASTQNTDIAVAALVWEPFYFGGNLLFDVGDKLVGKADAGQRRDRMVIVFDRVIFKDGRSLPINATAQDIDGTYGVKGIKVGDVMLNSLVPLLLDTLASFGGILQELATESISDLYATGAQSVGIQTQQQQESPGTTATTSSVTQGARAGQNVYKTLSKLLAEEVEDNRPYLMVPAGTRLQAFLNTPIDISAAGYGK